VFKLLRLYGIYHETHGIRMKVLIIPVCILLNMLISLFYVLIPQSGFVFEMWKFALFIYLFSKLNPF